MAYNILAVSRVDKFTVFRGKEPAEPGADTLRFEKALKKAFAVCKGSEKVLVKRLFSAPLSPR